MAATSRQVATPWGEKISVWWAMAGSSVCCLKRGGLLRENNHFIPFWPYPKGVMVNFFGSPSKFKQPKNPWFRNKSHQSRGYDLQHGQLIGGPKIQLHPWVVSRWQGQGLCYLKHLAPRNVLPGNVNSDIVIIFFFIKAHIHIYIYLYVCDYMIISHIYIYPHRIHPKSAENTLAQWPALTMHKNIFLKNVKTMS